MSTFRGRDFRDLSAYAVEPDSQLYLEVLQCPVADPWEGPAPSPPSPSSPFLHQTEARRVEKILEETAPLPPPPPNFEKIMVLILHKEVESKLESVRLV